jgi:hypothetical protein
MMLVKKIGVVCALVGSPVFAGSVITTNLSNNTAIVNIDAQNDGSNGFNGQQSLWYQPFSNNGVANIPSITVQPGTYNFRIVNPADASTLYPGLTTTQQNQIYTGWTYNSPWITNYLVFDSSAATDSSLHQLIYGAGSSQGYGSGPDAYAGAKSDGSYNTFKMGDAGYVASNPSVSSYTFTTAQTLLFVIPDYGLYDNAGGVSVLVSPLAQMAVRGDTDGDGDVDLDDLGNVRTYFGQGYLGTGAYGDTDFDGDVDLDDLGNVRTYFGQVVTWDPTGATAPLALMAVPEPGSLSLLGLAALSFVRRSRRR